VASLGRRSTTTLVLCLLALSAVADEVPFSDDLATADLGEIDRKLNNPLTDLWSLTFQENYSLISGDDIEDTYSNTFFFQPALPVPVGKDKDKIFIARPVFPLVRTPVVDPSQPGRVERHESGFGDMQVFAMVGPAVEQGLVKGVGATFVLPTASRDELGAGKWQAGPALLWLNAGKPWVYGVILQHWWSFAGDDDRSHVNRTELQYIFRHAFEGGWSLGMGPNIVYDWTAEPDDRLTLPIGLGITKTVRIGKMPVKFRFEPQYSIIRPDSVGTEWNFRIQIAPVIRSPFSR
jgi:hypothetical protein